MIQLFWSVVLLLWLVAPTLAATPDECRIVAEWSELYGAETAVLANSDRNLSALQRLRAALASSAELWDELRDFGTSADRSALLELLAIAQNTVLAAGKPDPQLLLKVGRDPATTVSVANAQRTLSRYDCSWTAPAPVAEGQLRPAGDAPVSEINYRGLSAMDRILTSWGLPIRYQVISLAMVVLCGLMVKLVVKRRQVWLRRSYRFPVNKRVQFSISDITVDGVILDVSCFGVKLRHNGAIGPQQKSIDIWLLEEIHTGRIAWVNRHYAGVLFDNRLRLTDVFRIVAINGQIQVPAE